MTDLDHQDQDIFDQFVNVTGIANSDDEAKDKVRRLLTIHDYNLNNAVSTYFDTGFSSVEAASSSAASSSSSPPSPPSLSSHATSTAVDYREVENDSIEQLTHRSVSRSSTREMVNLQNQMMMTSLIPRLPKAPQISTRWQLDVGIHSSFIRDREKSMLAEKEKEKEKEKGKGKEIREVRNSSILSTLCFILLLIPKNVLSMLITSIKFFFGFGGYDINNNNSNSIFRSSAQFNYENFDPDYSYIRNNNEWEKYALHESGFNEVHSVCQAEYDWLLVMLVNDSQECEQFVQCLLGDGAFNRLFNKDHGVYKETKLFIGNPVHSPEAFEIAKTYKVRKLPYVMLIAQVSPSHDIMPSMSIVYKLNISKQFIKEEEELNTTVSKMTKHLSKLCDKFNPQLVSARFDKQEMDLSRMIRQQQDDAYSQSLVQDQLKKRQRENELKAQQEAENLKSIRRWLLLDLFKSGFLQKVGNEEEENKLRVAIKLPDGRRLVESFKKSITTLDFYIFIELKMFVEELKVGDTLPEEEEEEEEEEEKKEDNIPKEMKERFANVHDYYMQCDFNFEILQPYPRKLIEKDAGLTIGEASDFFKGANFLVEYK
ncbi:hypothetical protein KGF56_001500 [Candida oxycetoniae]|uniref:UBX domain-containing protein n=1 Tax=Candida oxycetoniae TaxID=497107 RepID=A0AAI9WYN2_9ASCO|nr:uncharacterized protein KGF56_001500 [Candida oxycetoniae]KAI3405482.2 hypothetical protein KGF56_001500 [Candida oxycetoniae]